VYEIVGDGVLVGIGFGVLVGIGVGLGDGVLVGIAGGRQASGSRLKARFRQPPL
jgi:hypothetical protein